MNKHVTVKIEHTEAKPIRVRVKVRNVEAKPIRVRVK